MSKSIPGNQKHMRMEDRVAIGKELDAKLSLRSIALQLGKDPTTIAKEIKKHRSIQEHNRFNEPNNKCFHAGSCKKTFVVLWLQSVKELAGSVIIATPIVQTLHLNPIIAPNLTRLHLYVTAVIRKYSVAWIKPFTWPLQLTGSTGQYWSNPEQASTFLLKIWLFWMN